MYERFKNVKVKIEDADFLKTIPYDGVVYYLQKNGWELTVSKRKEAKKVVARKKTWFVHLATPEKNEEYTQQVRKILDVCQYTEEKNELDIVEEMFAYQEGTASVATLFSYGNDGEETEETFDKEIENIRVEYQLKMDEAIAYAKTVEPPHEPLWKNPRISKVFQTYWSKMEDWNANRSSYYNPKWLAHHDLEGEAYDIVEAMPWYPIEGAAPFR